MGRLGYHSVSGVGVSTANQNIIRDMGTVKNMSILVDMDCGISFNGGDFIKVKSGGGYNFIEKCYSVVIDTDGVGYDFGGEKFGEVEVI